MFQLDPVVILSHIDLLSKQTIILASTSEDSPGLFDASQMGGYASTAVWTIINVFIAYIVLKHLVFKPIIRLLDKRRTAVISELDDSAKKTADAQALLATANSRIEEAKGNAAEILADARTHAETQGRTIVDAAQAEASEIISRATEDARRMHNAMLDQMRDEVADLAISIASKVVGSLINDAHQNDLRDRIIDETLKAEVKKIE